MVGAAELGLKTRVAASRGCLCAILTYLDISNGVKLPDVHHDALSAWRALCSRGGIEIADRDEELAEALRERLAPDGGSLDEILANCSTAALIGALFDAMHPFIEMFRAILAFFERAGAVEGREQWTVQVDEVPLNLEHFRRFLKDWDSLECLAEVPAVDLSGAWIPHRIMREALENNVRDHGELIQESPEVVAWLRAYDQGIYKPFPVVLAEALCEDGLSDVVMLARAALTIASRAASSREQLIEEHRRRKYACDRSDGLHPWTIAQNETDFYLRTMVVLLARLMESAPDLRATVGTQLREAFAAYSRRKVEVRVTLAQVESILSLPVWKKRHELYAVWIATEIVAALHGHNCDLHHDNGSITFSFRETLVATIRTSKPVTRLISERRVLLSNPSGSGRVAGAQPDYGLWRNGANGTETCGVVIEVKHYKKAAPRRFKEVFEDYARAFNSAQIVLVNHGPMRDMMDELSPQISKRCLAIERLAPGNTDARSALAQIVRDYVGEPVVSATDPIAVPKDTEIALDVSGSMLSRSRSELAELLDTIALPSKRITLVDCRVVATVTIGHLSRVLASLAGSNTDLRDPIQQLLQTAEDVVVVTDDEGARQLNGRTLRETPSGIVVVHVTRARTSTV